MGRATAGGNTGERCELTVRGRVARSVVTAMRARFDVVSTPVTVDPVGSLGSVGTVLVVEVADQAAVRALMTMLWDSGHDVLAMTTGRGVPS